MGTSHGMQAEFDEADSSAESAGVAFCRPDFVADSAGIFCEFNKTQLAAAVEALSASLEDLLDAYARSTGNFAEAPVRAEPVWGGCTIWHDAFLNDVDDLPAIELARSMTFQAGQTFQAEQSFTLVQPVAVVSKE